MPNFHAHQPILITDLESLRVTSPEEYAVLKRQDIHSLLVFPLWNGKSLRGFVGVDNLDPERIDSSRVLLSSMKFFLSSSLWRRDSLNELHFLSYHDQLTGVFNRNAFQRDVQKRDADIGVIFLDINGLKDINDGDGYSGGDAVLAAGAVRSMSSCRIRPYTAWAVTNLSCCGREGTNGSSAGMWSGCVPCLPGRWALPLL